MDEPYGRALRTSMTQPADEPALSEPGLVIAVEKRYLFWRLEYVLLAASVLLVTAFAFAFFYFDVNIAELQTYGYVGVFAISLIGSASIFLPTQSIAAIFGGGAVLHPILGIPAPLVVGVVAGFGESLGEFTGYAAGYGGSAVIRDRTFYRWIQDWMQRHGSITMFVFSAIPNPVFDVAGTIAGATKMPPWKFFVAVWLGKTLKDIVIASTGIASLMVIQHVFD
jgi:membrane protein YqaA with SNARE-associated domain